MRRPSFHRFVSSITPAAPAEVARSAVKAGAILITLVLAAPAAVGQANTPTVFQVSLDGAQQTPSNNSAHHGDGLVFLDPISRVLKYSIPLSGLSGVFVSATLHTGKAAQSGPAFQALQWNGSSLSGVTTPITPTQMFALLEGDLYAQVTSTGFPSGELRGQITDTRDQWAAYLEPYKVVPAAASNGSSTAEFIHDPTTGAMIVTGSASSLSGPILGVSIRSGGPFTNGPLIRTVPVLTNDTYGGSLSPLSAYELAAARSNDWYVEIATAAHPSGEVRGTIAGSLLEYNHGCPGPNGPVRLSATGLPTPGGMIQGVVDGGNPNNPVLIFRSLQSGSLPVGYGCMLLTQPPIGTPVPAALDANGRIDIAKPISSMVIAPCYVSAQLFGFDPAAPNGFVYATNGLVIGITD